MSLEIKALDNEIGFCIINETKKIILKMLKDNSSLNEKYVLWKEELTPDSIHAFPLNSYSCEKISDYFQIVHTEATKIYRQLVSEK